MNLKLIRKIFEEECAIGQLFINNIFECFTLEDKVREIPGEPVEKWKVYGETAIPYGTYPIILDYSNRFKKIMPHLLNVPGFEGIRIHYGNTDEDTNGCILVGQILGGSNKISMSKQAYDQLFAKLESAFDIKEKIYIVIECSIQSFEHLMDYEKYISLMRSQIHIGEMNTLNLEKSEDKTMVPRWSRFDRFILFIRKLLFRKWREDATSKTCK